MKYEVVVAIFTGLLIWGNGSFKGLLAKFILKSWKGLHYKHYDGESVDGTDDRYKWDEKCMRPPMGFDSNEKSNSHIQHEEYQW